MNVVTTESEKKVKTPRENDKKVEESSSEKNVESVENPPTPLEKEVIKEVEKKAPYLYPPL